MLNKQLLSVFGFKCAPSALRKHTNFLALLFSGFYRTQLYCCDANCAELSRGVWLLMTVSGAQVPGAAHHVPHGRLLHHGVCGVKAGHHAEAPD